MHGLHGNAGPKRWLDACGMRAGDTEQVLARIKFEPIRQIKVMLQRNDRHLLPEGQLTFSFQRLILDCKHTEVAENLCAVKKLYTEEIL